ncbi:MAG: M23 family metallopeptidase [Opitutaceae bacterium]|nr:M23 family metallopeptidase [Verrucomicrobiales bacterium]
MISALALLAAVMIGDLAAAEIFQLPTANRAFFQAGSEEKFLVGTVGKPWTSGGFGCVRSDGWKMHEGLDIRAIQHDRSGEPTDPVKATADGDVAYVNNRPSLSNYGNYIVLRHRVQELEIYSVYAHLSAVRKDLAAGSRVKQGEIIATLGRTTNTRERISKDRAHVHFELNLVLSDRFESWYQKNMPGQRNDHGRWNGINMLGLDPRLILLGQTATNFSLVGFIQAQPELCRVVVRNTDFPFLRRYPALIQKNPTAEKQGVVAYEMALNFNGVPTRLIPRAASELKSTAKLQLLSVNEAEYKRCPCRRLVVRQGASWELGENGRRLIGLITY